MRSSDKRRRLLDCLESYDESLKQGTDGELLRGGRCLILGRHYAESRFVYFSLNPGFARNGTPLDPSSSDGFNVPFSNPENLRKQYVYLHNCQRFFNDHPALGAWINTRVTSAFLVPWRTANAAQLYQLNHQTGGALFGFAGRLVRQIISDHEATVLLMAGKSALTLFNDLAVADGHVETIPFLGPGGSYQWSDTRAVVEGRSLNILQIPHFSRANSPAKMLPFAEWLQQQLNALECL